MLSVVCSVVPICFTFVFNNLSQAYQLHIMHTYTTPPYIELGSAARLALGNPYSTDMDYIG